MSANKTESESEEEQNEKPLHVEIADFIKNNHHGVVVTQEEIQGEEHEFFYVKLEDEYLRVKPPELSSNMPVAEMKGTRMKRFTLIQEHIEGITEDEFEVKAFGELSDDKQEHISEVHEALYVGDESSTRKGARRRSQDSDDDVKHVEDDVETMSREKDARSEINPHSTDPEDQINTDAEDDLIHSGGTLREDEGWD